MSECFLFFRFWPGFTEPFPVDRFNAIADDKDLERGLDSYAREELSRPEVRRQIKKTAKERRRKLLAGLRKRSPPMMMDGHAVGVRKRLTKRDWYWPRIRQAKRRDPLVCRLGAYLGWWQGERFDSLPFGPTVWFCRVPSPELAEAVVSGLNGRTRVDYDENELEYHFRPRFGFVDNADITLQMVARRCIQAMRRGEAPDVRSGKAALAMGRKAMTIADEMLEAVSPPTPGEAIPAPPAANRATGKAKEGEGNAGADADKEIEGLEDKTPPLDRDSGEWVRSKIAAKLESLKAQTLVNYRTNGIKNTDLTLGRDKDGRVWRREGTPGSHPWYLLSTLLSEKRRHKTIE